MKISAFRKGDGQCLPPWYYGYTYRNWYYGYTVFHVIPFNYVGRVFLVFKLCWDKFRRKPSFIDRHIKAESRKMTKMCLEMAGYSDLAERYYLPKE